MKRNGTLVIIDMQPEFPASNNVRLLDAVNRKIRLAKRLDYGIIVIEYGKVDGFEGFLFGDTHSEITNALMNYKNKAFVVKHANDGSPQTVEAIEHYKFNRNHIYVCGVNTCCCVYATVAGLAKRLPDAVVYIQSDACNCGCPCDVRYHVTALRHQFYNVCLAPETRGECDEYHKPKTIR